MEGGGILLLNITGGTVTREVLVPDGILVILCVQSESTQKSSGKIGEMQPEEEKRSLTRDLAIDVAAAFGAGVSVAPFISLIDMAIIQNASGAKKLKESIIESVQELFFRPWKFVQRRSYHLVAGVYFLTYTAANTTDTICSHNKLDSKYPKFIATSATNIVVGIAKDRAFTRMFGLRPPSKLPMTTFALFGVRDSLTILASFTIPQMVGRQLQTRGYSEELSLNVAQLSSPVLVQFFSTPLHLTGLDLYNNPQHTSTERMNFVAREYLKSTFARMGRIFPAFGIGGVLNRKLRTGLNPQGAPKSYYYGK